MISFLPHAFLPGTLKKKMKYFKDGELYLHRYIDVYQMIKRFQETENLKQILLNNRQISLFNNIAKPKIVFTSELIRRMENQKRGELFYEEIAETLKGKKKGNMTDSKLLDMFNEGMGHRFVKESKYY